MDEKIKRKKVLAISGSTRKNSSNEAILKFIASTYKDDIDVQIYDQIAELPHFNPDVKEEEVSRIVKRLREDISNSDGIIICTPEYVYSIPGSLKNAIEWTVATTVFSNKPVALITASSLGEKAHESLKLIMKTIYAKVIDDACLLIQGVRGKIGNDGNISDEETLVLLTKLMNVFLDELRVSQKSK